MATLNVNFPEPKKSECISAFLNFIATIESSYNYNYGEVNNQDKLTQDLLHKLELEELDENDRIEIVDQITVNRKERRYAKDQVEELAPIYEFVTNNKAAINALKKVLGDVRKSEDYHAKRSYKPRVLKNS